MPLPFRRKVEFVPSLFSPPSRLAQQRGPSWAVWYGVMATLLAAALAAYVPVVIARQADANDAERRCNDAIDQLYAENARLRTIQQRPSAGDELQREFYREFGALDRVAAECGFVLSAYEDLGRELDYYSNLVLIEDSQQAAGIPIDSLIYYHVENFCEDLEDALRTQNPLPVF